MFKRTLLVVAAAVSILHATTTVEPMDPSDPNNQLLVVSSDHFIISVDLSRMLIRPVNDDLSEVMHNGIPLRAEIKAEHPQFNQLLAQALAAGNTGRIFLAVLPDNTSPDVYYSIAAIDISQY